MRDSHERVQFAAAGRASEDTCEYYERGLLAPGIDCNTAPPYLEDIGDRMDSEGYVHLPQEPGMGYRIIWVLRRTWSAGIGRQDRWLAVAVGDSV